MVDMFFFSMRAVLSASMQRVNTLMKPSKGICFCFLCFLHILSLYSALERGIFKVSLLL